MFAWNWLALPGIIATSVSVALAATVYLAAPRRSQNRRLAIMLVLVAAALFAYGPLRLLAHDKSSAYAALVLAHAVVPLSYLSGAYFLATLDSPLTRPLRSWPFMAFLSLITATVIAFVLFDRTAVVVDLVRTEGGFWNVGTRGWLWRPSAQWGGLFSFTFSAAVAYSVKRRARGSAGRASADAYFVAFVARDALLISYMLVVLSPWAGLVWMGGGLLNFMWLGVEELLFASLLAYGILKAQLFDIDLKLKWTLRRGTVVGVFLGAFLLATTIAEQWLERYGVVVGGLAAGALLLAARPIERAADRFVDAAMPRVQDTPEYRTVRKRKVYQAAVESALLESDISAKERGMLATLAEELGIGPQEMHAIERDVRASRAGSA